MYRKASRLLDKILNFASVVINPPKLAALDLQDADQEQLHFVEPTFVLSTGRCGTKWLTELLRQDKRVRVNHNDYPELLRESRKAYEGYHANPQLFQAVLRAARDGYLLDAHRRNQRYVETNHRITFFAYAIQKVYPKSRFIHLYRHPGDFVRSAVRRHWYSGTYYDVCRPCLKDNEAWTAMTDIEKLSWLWNATNEYIEEFLAATNSPDHYLRLRCEDVFSDVEIGTKISQFVGARLSRRSIEVMQKRRINQQRTGFMRPYDQWNEEEKQQLRRFASAARRYGYDT
jgi:hypothetical protein